MLMLTPPLLGILLIRWHGWYAGKYGHLGWHTFRHTYRSWLDDTRTYRYSAKADAARPGLDHHERVRQCSDGVQT
jgi:hypothetical protein